MCRLIRVVRVLMLTALTAALVTGCGKAWPEQKREVRGRRVVPVATTQPAHDGPETRVYDIRDYLAGYPEESPTVGSRQRRVERLQSLIREVVDTPSWKAEGGSIGSMRELQGQLVVTQTIENHQRIESLLAAITPAEPEPLNIECTLLIDPPLDTNTFQRFREPQAQNYGIVLTTEQVNELRQRTPTGMGPTRFKLVEGQRGVVAVEHVRSEPARPHTLELHRMDLQLQFRRDAEPGEVELMIVPALSGRERGEVGVRTRRPIRSRVPINQTTIFRLPVSGTSSTVMLLVRVGNMQGIWWDESEQ